ncbi:hypothetical protein [Methylobacterium oxalidis]|uniref:hypothetical protein n=1 Tax=Methylobacterium oxalidis TaxID=944322 RepID=UPI0033149E91
MSGFWFCDTQQGAFRIELMHLAGEKRYVIFFEDEPLGCCGSAEAALERLIRGDTYKPSCGLDIRRLPLPTALSGWVFAASNQVAASAEQGVH